MRSAHFSEAPLIEIKREYVCASAFAPIRQRFKGYAPDAFTYIKMVRPFYIVHITKFFLFPRFALHRQLKFAAESFGHMHLRT